MLGPDADMVMVAVLGQWALLPLGIASSKSVEAREAGQILSSKK